MALNVPFARGRNIKFSYRQNGVKIIAAFKANAIEELADEGADDVNGELRSRFWIVTNGYRVQMDGYSPDFAMLNSWLADTINDDGNNSPFSKAIGVVVNLLDGSTTSYRLSGFGAARSAFKFDAPDRKGALMQNISYRFPFMQLVAV